MVKVSDESDINYKKKYRMWRTIAIVMIVVTVLTSAFYWSSFYLGYKMIEAENNCYSTCLEDGGAVYSYDDTLGLCSCSTETGYEKWNKRLG